MRTLNVSFASLVLIAATAAAQTSPAPAHKGHAATSATHAAQSQPAAAPAGPPTATIDTTAGTMRCTLFPDKSPKGVENFAGLATGTKDWKDPKTGKTRHGVPLYNGTVFHRVMPNFMIQGGDPLGTGTGGPGYAIADELSPDLKFDVPGRLAYANAGPNTSGSQFFITEVPTPHLDACFDPAGCDRGQQHVPQGYGFVILGQCDNATVNLVGQIARRARDERNERPFDPVKINSITISGINLPARKPPVKKTTTTKKAPPKK